MSDQEKTQETEEQKPQETTPPSSAKRGFVAKIIFPLLLFSALLGGLWNKLMCMWGGVINVVSPGQFKVTHS